MGDSLKYHVEKTDLGFWTYIQRSAGELPEAPLHQILNWILEQLNLGNFSSGSDNQGQVVSLTIGKDAGAELESMERAAEDAQHRLLAVNVAGNMAGCRESGITPHDAHVSRLVTQQATDWGHRNTEFHYAFELIRVLGRLNKKTFGLEAPPISGIAPPSVVSYLRESTRCWLYNFHGAAVALNRACLEYALQAKMPAAQYYGPAKLEGLIDEARQRGLLDDCLAELAHKIRKTGNRFLHGGAITELDSREALDATRSLVEHMFSS